MTKNFSLDLTWVRPPWWRVWNRYEHGVIRGENHGVDGIYRNAKTGQVRLYTDLDREGAVLTVNGAPPVRMERRGRFGKLYLGFRP